MVDSRILRAIRHRTSETSGQVRATSAGAIFGQIEFRRLLWLEQRRCDRSGRRAVLMLVQSAHVEDRSLTRDVASKALAVVTEVIRDTDLAGWYEETTPGVIFTELGDADSQLVTSVLSARITRVLDDRLGAETRSALRLSFWHIPSPPGTLLAGSEDGSETVRQTTSQPAARMFKRIIDVVGSVLMLVLGLPLLLLVAAAVKLTSPGPVLFRQTRIGRNGRPFTFLKFRSMRTDNDPGIHQDFVTRLIRGELAPGTRDFKIVHDPRVTPFGRLLRKSSLDELPQLFNVLTGDMSLVGPRPPLPYEFECYKPWHRKRLEQVSPGITGLWQVEGRSRVGFDDMVRLDLRYARTWSLWLDLRILLATPKAVVSGNGAH